MTDSSKIYVLFIETPCYWPDYHHSTHGIVKVFRSHPEAKAWIQAYIEDHEGESLTWDHMHPINPEDGLVESIYTSDAKRCLFVLEVDPANFTGPYNLADNAQEIAVTEVGGE